MTAWDTGEDDTAEETVDLPSSAVATRRTVIPMRQRSSLACPFETTAQRVGFWQGLDEAERSALRSVARPRTYATRTPLCNQGDRSNHVVIIERGWAKVASATENGYEVVLAVRGPGDLVCEGAVLGRRQRSATVTAMSPLQTLVIPAGRFIAFLDQFPHVWRMVSAMVVHRLDDADHRVRTHASANGARRLALLLMHLSQLSRRDDPPTAHGQAIEIRPPLSQEELASWVDASRETVARALKVWRARGLVRTERRKITILDLPGLYAYAHERTLASDTG